MSRKSDILTENLFGKAELLKKREDTDEFEKGTCDDTDGH